MCAKKKKTNMASEHDHADLFRELGKQNFETEEDVKAFMENFMNAQDSVDMVKSDAEESQDLVYEAFEATPAKAKKLIKEALELDPTNVDAYNFMGDTEEDPTKAITFYKKAVSLGEKNLGKKTFKEDKGHFWGIFETRPYMRAKAGLADCYYATGQINEAIKHYKDLVTLNTNDNQGIRYLLSTLYLLENRLKDFERLHTVYLEDASAIFKFNKALCQFKKEGVSKKSQALLKEADHSNPHVIKYLLGQEKMPKAMPEYISPGDKNEAVSYVAHNYRIWDETKDALEWIFSFTKHRIRLN